MLIQSPHIDNPISGEIPVVIVYPKSAQINYQTNLVDSRWLGAVSTTVEKGGWAEPPVIGVALLIWTWIGFRSPGGR